MSLQISPEFCLSGLSISFNLVSLSSISYSSGYETIFFLKFSAANFYKEYILLKRSSGTLGKVICDFNWFVSLLGSFTMHWEVFYFLVQY